MQLSCTEERHQNGGPGRFLLTRSEDILPALFDEYGGGVQLIYLDPPFGTGDTFHIRLGDDKQKMRVPLFADTLDTGAYLTWMRQILTGCHKLLSDTGCLYLHIDYRMSAHLRLLLDEIFGEKSFMNEIVWCYKSGGRSTKYFPRKHDTILFYRKSSKVYFHIAAVGKPRGPQKRNHMKRFVDENGRVCFSIRSGGRTYIYDEDTPVYPNDVWDDIEHLQQKDSERVGYATQKPEALLERIILASSRPGDLVMDLFSGSGTTAAVASRLQRRYVVADASPCALYTLRARQLCSAEAPSLLTGRQEMRLCYPASDETATIDATPGAGGRVQIKKAYFDPSHPLVYLALGHADGSVFYPTLTDCRPRLPVTLNINRANGRVLHIADCMGKQAFIEL